MPCWSIHLAVAKKLNNKLNLNKDIFYLGNLVPDIEYGSKVNRKCTHYYSDDSICKKCISEILPNINNFFNDYKDKLNDDFILGYYIHLLTDYYYNNYIFSNCWVQNNDNEIIGIKLNNGKIINTDKNDIKTRKDYKHNDFLLYGKYLFNNNFVELPKYNNSIKDSIKLLKDNFYTETDMKERVEYLNTKFISLNKYNLKEILLGKRYKLLTKSEYDKLFNDCIEYILVELKKHDLLK